MGDRHPLRLGLVGAYKKITVDLPAGESRPWDADARLNIVGKPSSRIDARFKVSGAAKYTFDINLPGMLHGAVLRSPHAAAIVRSIDTSGAEALDGVRAIVPIAKPGDRMLFAGQDVVAVAAVRPEIAQDALAAITVRYDTTKFVTELDDALAPDAPVVHERTVEERRTEGDEPGSAGGSQARGNVRALRPMRAGDVAKGFKQASLVHEGTYDVPVITHCALETHGLVVRWDSPDRMTVWSSTQSIFSVRDEMAEVFGLKPADVHVITRFVGGGFGAKFGASAPGSRLGFIAGELAKRTKAPVKVMCDRHDEQVCTGNRPSARQVVRIGATKGGKLTAIHVVSHGSAGIGTGAGVGRNAFAIYTKCPNRLVESSDVFTHVGPGTAMRAPGHPQGAFAIELALDELAAQLGVDPLQLRIDHDEHPVRVHQFRGGAERFGWKKAREQSRVLRQRGARIRKGYGVAASIWGDFGRAKAAVATVSIQRDGTLEVRNGVQDIGTGIATVLAQVVAEVFGRPLDSVRVEYGDSRHGPSVGSGGSQTTSSVAPAVRNAAELAKADLAALAAKVLGAEHQEQVRWGENGSARVGDKSIDFLQLCQKMDGEAIVATATRSETYGTYPMAFPGQAVYQIAGVQFAEVEIDTWTGVVRVPRVLAVHDCGRVMNELTLRSQINGGVILGTSYALFEERIMDRDSGRMLNPNLESYKILGIDDCPTIDIMLTEVHPAANSIGAVGIGEPATIPTAAAIACAVFDAIGNPVRSLPITPDKVLAALDAGARGGGR